MNRIHKLMLATMCLFSFTILLINKLLIAEDGWTTKAHDSINSDFVILKMDKRILELRRQKAIERKSMLKEFWFIELFNILAPEALCPNIVRLGRIGDGGKWICNPFAILESTRPCIFYSLGLNNEVSFDVEFMNLTQNTCKHIAVDKDIQNSTSLKRLNHAQMFQAKISNVTNLRKKEYSFSDILNKFKTVYIDVLKMDIEGYEHLIIDQILSVPICQILIELHDTKLGLPRKTMLNDHERMYDWLHAMSLAGYYLIHYELNEKSFNAAEFTLLHKSCFEDYGINIILGEYLN